MSRSANIRNNKDDVQNLLGIFISVNVGSTEFLLA